MYTHIDRIVYIYIYIYIDAHIAVSLYVYHISLWYAKRPVLIVESVHSVIFTVRALYVYIYIYCHRCTDVNIAVSIFGLYTILPLPILYGVWRRQGGSGGGVRCMLHISRAIVSQ